MDGATNPNSFEQLVEWAYGTLPQKIRDLPDFPGIQVVDEPPPHVLDEISTEKNGAVALSYWDYIAARFGRNDPMPS